MNARQHVCRFAHRVRPSQVWQQTTNHSDPTLYRYKIIRSLCRPYHSSPFHQAIPSLSKPTRTPTTTSQSQRGARRRTAEEIRQAAAMKAKATQTKQQELAQAGSLSQGGLAPSSLFYQEETAYIHEVNARTRESSDYDSISSRDLSNMESALNPRPAARSRWQRKMVIREVKRSGRLTKATKIARTERSHLSKSHFFKTSVKKLAPLTRQIAGKSLDEAIVQMRFSRKKPAEEIRKHLIQARNEAVAMRGMGLGSFSSSEASPVKTDAALTPPQPNQNPTKSLKDSFQPKATDVYIAQAWVNRGPYGQEPDYRAKGRVNIMRPPYTGLSVLLKEEKTRTRERQEKEAKTIRKRMGKNTWTQLPDRPVTKQSQYVLW